MVTIPDGFCTSYFLLLTYSLASDLQDYRKTLLEKLVSYVCSNDSSVIDVKMDVPVL